VVFDDHFGRTGGDAVDVNQGDQDGDADDLDRRLQQRAQRQPDQAGGCLL
jgi:hypothetical protein